MAALSSIVNVSVSVLDVLPSKQGFGVMMIAGYHGAYADRSRTFTTLADMVTAGHTAGQSVYLAAASALAQNPNIGTFKVGRLGALADGMEQDVALTVSAADTTIYYIAITTLAGVESTASFTSGVGATTTQITAGLKLTFDALATDVGFADNDPIINLTNDNTGEYFAIRAWTNNPNDGTEPLFSRDEATADPGLSVDLTALAAADNDWYGLILADAQSGATITVGATWAESAGKFYLACSPDEDTLGSGGSDICATLNTAARVRTGVKHTRRPGDYPDAAWMSRVFTETPGAATWCHQASLSGVTVQAYTATQLTNITGNYGNVYDTTSGVSATRWGTMASGRFMDVQRFLDWLEVEVQTNIYTLIVNAKKIPFTSKGIAQVEGAIREAFQQGVDNGGLSDDVGEEYSITMPLISAVTTANKAARILTPITAQATLAGAVHSVTMTITLTL